MTFGATINFVHELARAAQIILQLEGLTTYPSPL